MPKARLYKVNKLTPRHIEGMWALFEQYYADIEYSRFISDLNGKSHVIVLEDEKRVIGFTTIKTRDLSHERRKVRVIFSGDTIVHRDYWGQRWLQQAFFLFVLRTYLSNPGRELYWHLISKGYKTYCLMSRGFNNYWPRYDAATPAFERSLMDRLSRDMFGECWKPELGVIQFDASLGSLKADIAPITDADRRYADIRFFEQANPGHISGDELCCLGKIDSRQVLTYAKKLLTHQMKIIARPRTEGRQDASSPADVSA